MLDSGRSELVSEVSNPDIMLSWGSKASSTLGSGKSYEHYNIYKMTTFYDNLDKRK